MFETSVTIKSITNLYITQHFIINCKLIYNYYNNYLEYQTRSKEVLPYYSRDTFLFTIDNSFLKIFNV